MAGFNWEKSVQKKYFVVISSLFIIAAIWLVAFWNVENIKRQNIEIASKSVKRLAVFFEQHAVSIFSYSDTYIKIIRRLYKHHSIGEVQEFIKTSPPDPKIISHITILDSTGKPLLVTGHKIKPGSTAKDRKYFLFQKNSKLDELYISLPLKGRNSGEFTLRAVRRLTDNEGKFNGAVFAAIHTAPVTEFFKAINLGKNSSATLVGMDKRIRARSSYGRLGPSQGISGSRIWKELAQSPTGSYLQKNVVDQITRFYAYRKVPGFPLIVAIGVSLTDISKESGNYHIVTFVIAGSLTLFFLTLAFILHREMKSRQILEAEASERKRAEERARESEEQLRQAQKMEAIGQLAGGVAHDFNNLLQVILGYNETVLGDDLLPDKAKKKLMLVRDAANRAATLTKQLLGFSRRQTLQITTFDLNNMVVDQMKMVNRLIGENIEFEVSTLPGSAMVEADQSAIEQVLLNICINARDAMADGGNLSIRIQSIQADKVFCAHHAWAGERQYHVISVTDSGSGMSQEVIKNIFDPFFTTKEIGQGSGLGLSMAYGIVEQHKGHISAYSEPGLGSTFKIYLPASMSAGKVAEEFANTPALVKGSETILVAEDEKSVLEFVSFLLEEAGYKVIRAGDGAEALELFQKHQGEIDLILMDMVMPKMNGRKVFEEIRRVNSTLPVIFCTGYAADSIDARFLVENKVRIIEKPFQTDSLFRIVREHLER